MKDEIAKTINDVAEYMKFSRTLELGDGVSVLRDVSTPVRVSAGKCRMPSSKDDGVTHYDCDALSFLGSGEPDKHISAANREMNSWDIIVINEPCFPAAWRLFVSSLRHVHAFTIWFIVNVLPVKRSIEDDKFAGDGTAGFKTIFSLREEHPEFSCCTLAGVDAPFSVIWRQPLSISPEKIFSSLEEIEQLHLFELFKHPDLMNPISADKLFAWMGLPYKANAQAVEAGLKMMLRHYYGFPDGQEGQLVSRLIDSVIENHVPSPSASPEPPLKPSGKPFPSFSQKLVLVPFHLFLKIGPADRLKRYERDPEEFFAVTTHRYCLPLRKFLTLIGPAPRDGKRLNPSKDFPE